MTGGSDETGKNVPENSINGTRPMPAVCKPCLMALCMPQPSASAVAETGWAPQFLTLEMGGELCGAAALYLKSHSYGEYVFLCRIA